VTRKGRAVYVLVVSLRVKPERDHQFLTAIEANATASRRDEPGCRRFDVLRDQADSHHYLLYEIYDDEAAFQAHRATPHFPAWRRAAAECLDEQINTAATLLYSGDLDDGTAQASVEGSWSE
jgi:(4S)-4-hydroxy-5-phosphonooxypentane-2,3-dione isomerase